MRIDPPRALFSLVVLASHVLSDVVPSDQSNPANNVLPPPTDTALDHNGPTPTLFSSSVSKTAASASSRTSAVVWQSIPTAGMPLGAPTIINYEVLNATEFEQFSLVLCQTNATESITTDNTWSVWGFNCDAQGAGCSVLHQNAGTANITLYPGQTYKRNQLDNFFLCFARGPSSATVPDAPPVPLDDLVCAYSSPLFDILPSETTPGAVIKRVTATGQVPLNLPIKKNNPVVSGDPDGAAEAVGIPSSTNPSVIGSMVTVSISPTTTVTPSAVATSLATAPPTPSVSSSSSGLSTGAKVGIAVGVAFGAIFIALIAFCLVRRRRSRNDHMMLSRSPPTEFPRSMENLAEKMTRSYPNITTPETTQLSQHLYSDQHPDEDDIEPHAVSFYGPPEDSSRPASLVPLPPVSHSRSGSQSQIRGINQEENGTRPLSSLSSALSPRSIHSQQSTGTSHDHDEEDSLNEPFHDRHSPVYGDARHTPVTQVSRSREGVTVFLGEPGMTEEELERLEDEERRIDAAIEEAERSRHNNER